MRHLRANTSTARGILCGVLVAACLALLMGVANKAVGQAPPEQTKAASSKDGAIVLAMKEPGGTVRVSVILPRGGETPKLVRVSSNGEAVDLTSKLVRGSLVDSPGSGLFAYEVRVGDEVWSSAQIDLRAKERITFLGGTSRRALFEYQSLSGESLKFFVAVGAPIEAALLASQVEITGQAPPDDLVEVQTGLRLDAVRMAAALSGTRQVSLYETTASGSESSIRPASGIDGAPMSIATTGLRVGVSRMAAVIDLPSPSGRVSQVILSEGESLEILPRK